MFLAGFEPATFRVWDGCDNHYTTETHTRAGTNSRHEYGRARRYFLQCTNCMLELRGEIAIQYVVRNGSVDERKMNEE